MKLHTESLPSRIQTFTPGDLHFAKERERFEGFIARHFLLREGKYFENYGPTRYRLTEQVALSIETDGDDVLATSSVFQSPTHYPPFAARIANRYLKSNSVRRYIGRRARAMTVQMIDQQVDFCREHEPELKWLFISRQAPSGAQFVRHFVENVLSSHSRYKGWKFTEELYLVCGSDNSATCWHHLVYLDLTDTPSIPFTKKLTLDEWRQRFG